MHCTHLDWTGLHCKLFSAYNAAQLINYRPHSSQSYIVDNPLGLGQPLAKLQQPVEKLQPPVEKLQHDVEKLQQAIEKLQYAVAKLRHVVSMLERINILSSTQASAVCHIQSSKT